jgi:hypothetical protein
MGVERSNVRPYLSNLLSPVIGPFHHIRVCRVARIPFLNRATTQPKHEGIPLYGKLNDLCSSVAEIERTLSRVHCSGPRQSSGCTRKE